MPSLTSPFRRIGRLLVSHIRRLRAALEVLSGQVRATLARVIGQATGDAVREAVGVILDGPLVRLSSDELPPDREGLWGQPRRPSWPGHAYDPYDRDPYATPERYREEEYSHDDHEELPESETVAQPQRPGAWSRAVATGCQAAAWWLRRHPGPFALVAAASIGLAAGVAALVGGPFVAGTSAVVASALGVLALADAARSAATLASVAVT